MDVELYVYDLSRGLARNMSAALVGVQLDAIYHTAIVLEGVEYGKLFRLYSMVDNRILISVVYDGGIQMATPGMTHLGKPMQILNLGRTSLPMDIIRDYIESMRPLYTAEV